MKKYTRHIERNELKDATHIEVSVYYSKGGTNLFSGQSVTRGYYLSVKPITIRDNAVSFVLFSGKVQFLFETKRYSDKQFDRAVELSKDFEEELISSVLSECKVA